MIIPSHDVKKFKLIKNNFEVYIFYSAISHITIINYLYKDICLPLLICPLNDKNNMNVMILNSFFIYLLILI
jgi:hypothetical protein